MAQLIKGDRQIHFDLQVGRPDGVTWESIAPWCVAVNIELGNVDMVGTGQSGTDSGVRRMDFTLINDGTSSFHTRDRGSEWNQFDLGQGKEYAPLLYPNREVVAWIATTDPGQEPEQGDWKEVFRGYIVKPRTDGGRGHTIRVECIDLAHRLQRAYMLRSEATGQPRMYPKSGEDEPVEKVMQDILGDNGFDDVIIYSPNGTEEEPIKPEESPFWDIPWDEDEPLGPQYETVWSILQQIVSQFGWFLGYRWHENTGKYQLVLMEPPRQRTVNATWEDYANKTWQELADKTWAEITATTEPDFELDYESDFYEQALDISAEDVRNIIWVNYRDAEAEEEEGDIFKFFVVKKDQASIDTFGELPMEIELGDTPLVLSEEEAERLAGAALADLKDLQGITRINMPLWPEVDLFACIRVKNPLISSTRDLYGVESVSHRLRFGDSPSFRTETVGSGRVTGGKQKWLKMQTRPGAVSPIRPEDQGSRGPQKPTGVVVSSIPKGIEVEFDRPKNPWWRHSEVHVSFVSGYTPSLATRKAYGQQTVFQVTEGLSPGTPVYVRVIHKDGLGTRSEPSDETTVTPGPDTRSATLVVAASNSSQKAKDGADYVCDGADDQVEIQQAIDEIGGTGGKVVLMEGLYTVAKGTDNYCIVTPANLTFAGLGANTVIKLADGVSDTTRIIGLKQTYPYPNGSPGDNLYIKELKIDGNKANQNSADHHVGLFLHNSWDTTIENVYIENCTHVGLWMGQRNIANNISSAHNGNAGVHVRSTCKVTNSKVFANAGHGVELTSAFGTAFGPNAVDFAITNNEIFDNDYSGIYLAAVADSDISGNKITGNGQASDASDENRAGIALTYKYAQGTYSGSDYNNIQNNTIRADGEPQKYGIFIDVPNSDNLVANNDLYNSGTESGIKDKGTNTNFGGGNRVNDGSWSVSADG